MNDNDLQQLIEASRQGDHNAFGKIVKILHGEVRGFAAMLGAESSWLDDVCQEVFIETYRALEKYDPEYSFRKWIRGIARNIVARFRTKMARERVIREGATAELLRKAVEEETLPAYCELTTVETMKQCLQRLSENLREMLLLRYSSRMNSDEIGEEFGQSPASVRMSLMRTRKKLIECIASNAQEGL